MKVRKITEGKYPVWVMEGEDDIMKRHDAFMKEYFDRLMFFGEPTIDEYKEMNERHGLPFIPPTSRVGKHVMTNRGLMYQAYGKYFELLSTPDDISNIPFEGEVFETRAVSSFDF